MLGRFLCAIGLHLWRDRWFDTSRRDGYTEQCERCGKDRYAD